MKDAAPTHGRDKRIGELLIELGFVTEEQMRNALALAKERKIRIGEALASLGLLDKDQIYWVLGTQLHMTYIEPSLEMLNADLINQFPIGVLRELSSLPLYETLDEIHFAVADPADAAMVERVKRLRPGKKVTLHLAVPEKIAEMLDVFGQPDQAVGGEGAYPRGAAQVLEQPELSLLEAQWSDLRSVLVSAQEGDVFWLYEAAQECRLFRKTGESLEPIREYASSMSRVIRERIEKHGAAVNLGDNTWILLVESDGQQRAVKVSTLRCLGKEIVALKPIATFSHEQLLQSEPAIPTLVERFGQLLGQRRRLLVGGEPGLLIKECCCAAVIERGWGGDFPRAWFVERDVEMYFPEVAQLSGQAFNMAMLREFLEGSNAPLLFYETECSALGELAAQFAERATRESTSVVIYSPFASVGPMRKFMVAHKVWRQKGFVAVFLHNHELKTI